MLQNEFECKSIRILSSDLLECYFVFGWLRNLRNHDNTIGIYKILEETEKLILITLQSKFVEEVYFQILILGMLIE